MNTSYLKDSTVSVSVSNLRSFVSIFALCTIVFTFLLRLLLPGTILQQPAPHRVAAAIVRLSRHPEQTVEPVLPERDRWVQYPSEAKGDAMEPLLRARGWQIADQWGAVRIFRRGKGEVLHLSCSPYSEKYQVCTADRVP